MALRTKSKNFLPQITEVDGVIVALSAYRATLVAADGAAVVAERAAAAFARKTALSE